MKLWFEEFPERLDYELNALRDAGFSYSIDEALRASGVIVITVIYPLDGVDHPLTVHFPDFYPYLLFEIFGKSLPPGKHICPTSGNLCLIQNPQTTWSVNDTLSGFLINQVPIIIQAHLDPDNADEAKEGTQRSGQYPYLDNSIILTQSWNIPSEHTSGRLIIGLESPMIKGRPIRGAVLEIQEVNGNPLASLDKTIKNRFPLKIKGRWVRLNKPPDFTGIDPMIDLVDADPSLTKIKLEEGVEITGVLFPEESGYKELVENWIFTLRSKHKDKNGPASYPLELIRSDCLDRENMMARVASLSALQNKKVLIVGLGAIGSIIAAQLARAGVEQIKLLDHDVVQIGNIPRWLLGINVVGRYKAEALANFLATSYPFGKFIWIPHRIGHSGDKRNLDFALKDTDLVVDATAEWGINNLLATMCHSMNISYIWASGTQGSRGGVVGRVVPGKTKGCWSCFQHMMYENLIIPPVADNLPDIQPKGCFHPTFQGTGFDMDNISLAATRLVASTLCSSETKGYPDVKWDVGVVNLWNNNEVAIAPEWTTYPLPRHPSCPNHDEPLDI